MYFPYFFHHLDMSSHGLRGLKCYCAFVRRFIAEVLWETFKPQIPVPASKLRVLMFQLFLIQVFLSVRPSKGASLRRPASFKYQASKSADSFVLWVILITSPYFGDETPGVITVSSGYHLEFSPVARSRGCSLSFQVRFD